VYLGGLSQQRCSHKDALLTATILTRLLTLSNLGAPATGPLARPPHWGKTTTPDCTHKRAYVGCRPQILDSVCDTFGEATSLGEAIFAIAVVRDFRPSSEHRGRELPQDTDIDPPDNRKDPINAK
jgi:hypothetical protein